MNRNIILTLWMAAALPLLLSSCQQEELPGMNGASDTTPLSITVTDGGYASTDKAATRAAENGYRTEFTAGDACGLYIVRRGTVVYDNVKLTATAGTDGSLTWKPEAGEPLAGGLSDEKYFLYYPYQSYMSGQTTASATDADGFFAPLVNGCQPATDQSTYTTYTAYDLMTAEGIATKSMDGTLSLSFAMTHRMAMAVIDMPKTVYKFTDNGNGAIPDYSGTTAIDFTDSGIKPCRMVDGTYRCIVKPASSTAVSITGSYADGKKAFVITLSNIAAGSYRTYKVDGATQSEKQATLQAGDYFCKSSDNKWYIIPQEAGPDGNVIGIVFHIGQHDSDNADYTNTGIGQEKCHGYVVALTNVHNDESDLLSWECGPNNEYNQEVGTSTNDGDWQGYSNHLKFREFVEQHSGEGWEMKHFPAALACETYGNQANGIYDCQQQLAAPSNTSGWFLPSCGQLKYLYQNSSVLSVRMDVVKNSTPANCIYKDKIMWFYKSYYWSSTEGSQKYAWAVIFGDGTARPGFKSSTNEVRAVLAF